MRNSQISKVVYEMKQGISGIKFNVPKDYKTQIDVDAIAKSVASGMSGRQAIIKEVSKISEAYVPTLDNKQIKASEAREYIYKAAEYNKSRTQFKSQDYINKIGRADQHKMKSVNSVFGYDETHMPKYSSFTERQELTASAFQRAFNTAFSHANIPEDLKQDFIRRYSEMSIADQIAFREQVHFVEEIFDSKQGAIRTNFADVYSTLIQWQKQQTVDLEQITTRKNTYREEIQTAVLSGDDSLVPDIITELMNQYGR